MINRCKANPCCGEVPCVGVPLPQHESGLVHLNKQSNEVTAPDLSAENETTADKRAHWGLDLNSIEQTGRYTIQGSSVNQSPILRIHADGKVELGDHLTPLEGSELAWSLIRKAADEYNSNLSQIREENERLRAALKEVMSWVKNWDVPFLEDDEWADTAEKVRAALEHKP